MYAYNTDGLYISHIIQFGFVVCLLYLCYLKI